MITFPLHRAQSEFTLIELLTVIAIIGILAAIVIPTVGSVREKAQRAVDANNLREIAKAAMIYASDNKDRLPNPDTIASSGGLSDANKVFLWPGILARTKALNDASFYFSKIDPSFDGEVPAAIISPNNNKALDSSFTSGRELSLEFVGGLKMSDPPSTPVAFTRGLRTDGTWDPDNGVYGDTGGYVVFLGGNVEFYPDTATDKFIDVSSGQRTDNILLAIPNRDGVKIWGTSKAGTGSPGGVSK